MSKKRLQELQCRDARAELLGTVSTRRMAITDAKIRFADDSKTGAHTFEGYAVKWDSTNQHRERFARGAFNDMIEAVNNGDKVVHMYYNHGWRNFLDTSSAMRIGRWVEIVEDDIGLKLRGELTPALLLSDNVGAMMRHGTIDGLSIAFYPVAEMDYEQHDDYVLIKRADLFEISVVDEPSDRAARISRQSETINNLVDERDACDMLTKLGLNPDDARNFITKLDHIMGANDDTGGTTVPTPDDDPFAFLDNAS